MKIIISPAKKMRADSDSLAPHGLPELIDRAGLLLEYLRELPLEELRRLLACNGQIAELNHARYRSMDLRRGLTPALLSYDGIQYQYMAPSVFTDGEFAYLEEHLRILSGFYGILRPFDGVTPYRLEMQAKLKTGFCASLYDYWGGTLADCLTREDDTVLNLASEEYAKAVRRRLKPGVQFITVRFAEYAEEKPVEKGVYVKMARGEMVRFLAERAVARVEEIRAFDRQGYRYRPDLSSGTVYWFVRERTGKGTA